MPAKKTTAAVRPVDTRSEEEKRQENITFHLNYLHGRCKSEIAEVEKKLNEAMNPPKGGKPNFRYFMGWYGEALACHTMWQEIMRTIDEGRRDARPDEVLTKHIAQWLFEKAFGGMGRSSSASSNFAENAEMEEAKKLLDSMGVGRYEIMKTMFPDKE